MLKRVTKKVIAKLIVVFMVCSLLQSLDVGVKYVHADTLIGGSFTNMEEITYSPQDTAADSGIATAVFSETEPVVIDIKAVAGATATNAADSGVVTAVFPATTGPAEISIATITGVTVPATGAFPDTTVDETSEYTATISWLPADTTFKGSTEYTATITITPKAGYTLTGVPVNFFTVDGATATNAANSGIVTAVFPFTKNKISIQPIFGVTVPATGATPDTTVDETAHYTATISWSPVDATFKGSQVYTATITVTPKAGYTLTGVPANFFTVAGATATNAVDSGIVTAVFPATAPAVISIAGITGITVPATGATPTATIADTTEYAATISWLPADATFKGSTVYTATITITPKAGYTLIGVPANFFTVAGATVTNADDSGVVTAVFPATEPTPVGIHYTLTYTAGINGTIAGTATQTVNSGAHGSEVTAIPNSGYHFVRWSDGVTTATRTDSSVTANITVSASFAENTSKSPSDTPSDTSTATPVPFIEILFNNDKVNFATSDINLENGKKKTTIKLDDEMITNKLDKEKEGSTIIIPVNNNSDIVIGQLNGQTVKNMQDNSATLEIKTEHVIYTIPAEDINIDSVLKEFGGHVQLKDITINITVSNSPKETRTKVENSAKMNNLQLVVNPVDFEITCTTGSTTGSKTVTVSKFNNYVERTVILPDGIDNRKITTGVVLNEDGSFSHVPTAVKLVDGKYHAKINSLTNSTYTIVWNPVTFKDVEKHWSKSYVNNTGSRLIDDGVGNSKFAPNQAITRAEFASMIVKALGLKGTNFQEKFSDVKKSDPYYSYIYTAYEYGIMDGYSNGKFGPQDVITREQAMTMLVKAMDIVGVEAKGSDMDVTSQLKRFKDSSSISKYAKKAAAICVKNGIFVGDKKGRLNPKGNLTRAESATIIIRILKKAELI